VCSIYLNLNIFNLQSFWGDVTPWSVEERLYLILGEKELSILDPLYHLSRIWRTDIQEKGQVCCCPVMYSKKWSLAQQYQHPRELCRN
jgi:hypothetical protein